MIGLKPKLTNRAVYWAIGFVGPIDSGKFWSLFTQILVDWVSFKSTIRWLFRKVAIEFLQRPDCYCSEGFFEINEPLLGAERHDFAVLESNRSLVCSIKGFSNGLLLFRILGHEVWARFWEKQGCAEENEEEKRFRTERREIFRFEKLKTIPSYIPWLQVMIQIPLYKPSFTTILLAWSWFLISYLTDSTIS